MSFGRFHLDGVANNQRKNGSMWIEINTTPTSTFTRIGGNLNECAHGLCKCAKYLHRFEYALQMFAYDQSQRIKYISDTVILRLPKHVIYSHVAFVHVFTVPCWNDASKWIVYPQFGSVSIEFCSLHCIILFENISGTNGWVIAKNSHSITLDIASDGSVKIGRALKCSKD